MSDTHEFDPDHVRPVPLTDIPRHTWEVTTVGTTPRQIVCHMALRPTGDFPFWKFADLTDVEGRRLERKIELLAQGDVTSVVRVYPDGSRREMVK